MFQSLCLFPFKFYWWQVYIFNNFCVYICLHVINYVVLLIGSINEIIDTQCNSDTDCREFEKVNQVANATCFNHHCLCKDSDFNTIECLPHVNFYDRMNVEISADHFCISLQKQGFANVIGGKCPCSSIKWSTCVNGFCMCKPGFTSSEAKRSCIPSESFFSIVALVYLGDCMDCIQLWNLLHHWTCKFNFFI